MSEYLKYCAAANFFFKAELSGLKDSTKASDALFFNLAFFLSAREAFFTKIDRSELSSGLFRAFSSLFLNRSLFFLLLVT